MTTPQAYHQTRRKARKEHKCCNCYQKINKGERYVYISGIWDKPQSFKSCSLCYSIMENFQKMDDGLSLEDGPGLGDLKDFLQGYLCYSYKGMEAAEDMSKIFDVPVNHMALLLGVKS